MSQKHAASVQFPAPTRVSELEAVGEEQWPSWLSDDGCRCT